MQHAGREGTGSLEYQPALDGLRAVSVVLVLLFHQGFGWMSGGYVGVSVFFTLSGYLITCLLLAEWTATASISVRSFYLRRLRRLAPASLLCLFGIGVAAASGAFPPAAGLDRSILGALAQVANWEALTRGASYTALLTGGATPVDHFWSLAVEEQFYWCWPLVALAVFRATGSSRVRALVVGVIAAVFVALGPAIAAEWGPDAAYWATPARLGEILTGAALALAVAARRRTGRSSPHPVAEWAGWLGMAAILAAALLLPADSGPAYRGLLGVGSLASVAVVLGLSRRTGPLARLLAGRPLVALGRRSYGVYVYHWPVFLAIRPGDASLAAFALRLAVTLCIAALSYRYVEQPIRAGQLDVRRSLAAVCLVAAAIAMLAVTIVPSDEPQYAADPEIAAAVGLMPVEGTLAPLTAPPATVAAPDRSDGTVPVIPPAGVDRLFPELDVPAPDRPVRVLVLGDSTGIALAGGLMSWAADHPEWMQVTSLAAVGCGLIRNAWKVPADDPMRILCDQSLDVQLPALLASTPVDVIVVHVSLVDAGPRQWDESEGLIDPTDPLYAERLDRDYQQFSDTLLGSTSARILWVMPTHPAEWFLGRINSDFPPAWWYPQESAIRRLARGSRAYSIELGAWIAKRERDGSRTFREDGLHLSADGARLLADQELGEGIVALALGLLDDA